MCLLNGTLINEAVFSYERLDLQLNVSTQQASLSSKKCPCAVFTVNSKTRSQIEEIQTGFIFSLLYPVPLEQGGLQRPESSLTHPLGPERGFTPSSNPRTLCRHMLLPGKGNHLGSCLVVARGMTHWFTASPDLPGSANSLARLLPPLLRLLHTPFSEDFLLPVLAGLMGGCIFTVALEPAQVHEFGLSWVWLRTWQKQVSFLLI